jgi:dynactin 4
MASLTGSSEGTDRQPEAGKIWEKSRNSTSVIIEVVPGALRPPPSILPNELTDEELDEDDDVLEIPVYVRVEWEAEVKPGDSTQAKKDAGAAPGEKISKELGYWVVLAVGRIAV